MFGHYWEELNIPGMGMMYATLLKAATSIRGAWPNRAVAIHMQDMSITIFDLPDNRISSIRHAGLLDCIPESEVCLDRLCLHLDTDSVIKVIEEYHEERFFDQHPSSAYYDDIIAMWKAVPRKEWELFRYGGWRLGLRKDITYLEESSARSILVAENGVTLFLTRVAEATDGKGLFITSENLSEELLAGFMVWADARECYEVHRTLRRWIFVFALRREQRGEE